MKNLLLFTSIVLVFSCTQDDKFKDSIKSYLLSKTLGVQIKFNIEKLNIIEKYTADEVIKDYYKNLEISDDRPKEIIIQELNNIVNENDMEDSNSPSAIAWNFKLERFKEVSKKNPDEIEYYIVLAKYNFKNPILNNATVELLKYFIVNSEYKVIASVDKENLMRRGKENNKTPLTKYEISILSERENIEI